MLMNEASQKSRLETSPDTTSATSLRESADGRLPSSLPESQPIQNSGLEAVPVSPSAPPPANEKEPMTGVISGPYGKGSSASASLQSSLENKLKTLLDTVGSILWQQTWRNKVTPAGRPYLAHTAS